MNEHQETVSVTIQDLMAAVAGLIEHYWQKPENICGGRLHLVLDDGNIEDHHISSCMDYAQENSDADGVRICRLLKKLSVKQRKEVIENDYEDLSDYE